MTIVENYFLYKFAVEIIVTVIGCTFLFLGLAYHAYEEYKDWKAKWK